MDNYGIADIEILEAISNWETAGVEPLVRKYKAPVVQKKLTDLHKSEYISFDDNGTSCWLTEKGKEYLRQLKSDE